jgi:hypothetical protein
MSGFKIDRVREPELVFANGGTASDPRAGLLQYGPCSADNLHSHQVIRVGIVGSEWSISKVRGLLKEMEYGIRPNEKKRSNHPFPPLGPNSALQMEFDHRKEWRKIIHPNEIEKLSKIPENKRVEKAIEYTKRKLEGICTKNPKPHVVIVSIPDNLADLLTPDKKGQSIRTEETDFRSRVKLLGIYNDTPTQLMKPATLKGEDVQSEREIAWNLAVGLMYKAREGRPWKLAELKSNTCYVGLSFFDERTEDPDTRASIAQVFMQTGDNFVIRGGRVDDIASDKKTGRTHLSREDAEKLISKVLEQYGEQVDQRPNRLVIHKSSNFWDQETQGFKDGSADVPQRDFITIRENHPLRVFSQTQEPPLRGTVVLPPGQREYYLYTKGYTPEFLEYNESGTPNPIVIRPSEEVNDSSYTTVCQEIMSLSKLDWNSSDYCTKLPVTVGIADSVSDVLAEKKADAMPNEMVPYHYYYYM